MSSVEPEAPGTRWGQFKQKHIREDWLSQVLWSLPICAAFGLIGWLASHGVTCR